MIENSASTTSTMKRLRLIEKKKLILWAPLGQMGNQLFQYQALLTYFDTNILAIAPRTALTSLFKDTPRLFSFWIPSSLSARLIDLWLRILEYLTHRGIIGIIYPESVEIKNKYCSEGSGIVAIHGKIPGVFVFRGFFQYEVNGFCLPEIKPEIKESAKNRLSGMVGTEPVVAVHMRFNDYKDWNVLGIIGVSLPWSYYDSAIDYITKITGNAMFVVFSDDRNKAIDLIEHNCKYTNSTVYFGESDLEDLVAMSLCDHAILSASSFSWWGAKMICNPDRIIIAPKYWAGFKSQIWFPATLVASDFVYLDGAVISDMEIP